MAVNRTSLSAGILIREILMADENIQGAITKIFPVMADNAVLPYIVYRRAGLNTEAVKARAAERKKNGRPLDTTNIEVYCYAKGYNESVDMAEAVRDALDCRAYTSKSGMQMRSCFLVDSDEGYEGDAWVQQLVFEVKI